MNGDNAKKTRIRLAGVVLGILMLAACGGKTPEGPAEPVTQDPQLGKAFANIVVNDFTASPEIARDYAEDLQICQQNLIDGLKAKGNYQSVVKGTPGLTYGRNTLVVKTTVSELRIVSTGARVWLGAMMGSSNMNMLVQFVDASNNQVLREKSISSSGNAVAAAWTGGSTDRSFSADMGQIAAAYIAAVVPAGAK